MSGRLQNPRLNFVDMTLESNQLAQNDPEMMGTALSAALNVLTISDLHFPILFTVTGEGERGVGSKNRLRFDWRQTRSRSCFWTLGKISILWEVMQENIRLAKTAYWPNPALVDINWRSLAISPRCPWNPVGPRAHAEPHERRELESPNQCF